MSETLRKIRDLIEDRKGNDPEKSYVSQLLTKGTKKIAEKVGEEATEVVIAGVSEGKSELISESADLLFHLSVLWADRGVEPDEVMAELESRIGISGLDEKAARKANNK